MPKIIVAMLKDRRGVLTLSTAQDTVANCEAYCEQHIINFDEKKEAGAKVVQVELRELPADGDAATQAAARRVADFLKQRAGAHGADPAEIASLNAGSEREANLFTADLLALVNFANGT